MIGPGISAGDEADWSSGHNHPDDEATQESEFAER